MSRQWVPGDRVRVSGVPVVLTDESGESSVWSMHGSLSSCDLCGRMTGQYVIAEYPSPYGHPGAMRVYRHHDACPPTVAGCVIDGGAGIVDSTVRLVRLAVATGLSVSESDLANLAAYAAGEYRSPADVDDIYWLADDALAHLQGLAPEGMWLDWHEGDLMLQASEWWDER